jgi:prolyl-tRNA synthetase
LIGLPIRITVGERGLKTNTAEVKLRASSETTSVQLQDLEATIKNKA